MSPCFPWTQDDRQALAAWQLPYDQGGMVTVRCKSSVFEA